MSFIISNDPADTTKVVHPFTPVLPHDSAANWATINPLLAKGVIVYEDDDALNPKFKMGNGVALYNDLPYLRIPKRTTTITSSATPSPNADTTDLFEITALAAAAAIAAPTGTPVNLQTLVLRIKDNGTIRSLSWNAAYRAIGVTLPTTTVAGKVLYIGMFYNSTDSKWDVTAVGQQA